MRLTKWMGRALCALVLTVVAATLVAVPAFAKEESWTKAEPYTYTVRVYAGNKGTVNGNEQFAEITKIPAGTTLSLSEKFQAEAKDANYYVKGFRVGGTDDLDGVLKDNIVVDKDMDFVVSYGYKKNMAKLTIKFVDEKGNAIKDDLGKDSVTIEAAVGDKPVVAYHYCPGYRPSYRNVSGTLKAGDNSMALPYKKIETTTTSNSSSSSSNNSSSSNSNSNSSSSNSNSNSNSSSSNSNASNSSSSSQQTATTATPNGTTAASRIPGLKMVGVDAASGIVESVRAEASDASTPETLDLDSMTDEEIKDYRANQKPTWERLNTNSFGFIPMAIVVVAVAATIITIVRRVISDRHESAEA